MLSDRQLQSASRPRCRLGQPLFLSLLLAQAGRVHARPPSKTPEALPPIAAPASSEMPGLPSLPDYAAMHAIELAYLRSVEPIFARTCFGCHTPQASFGWLDLFPMLTPIARRAHTHSLRALDLSAEFLFVGPLDATTHLQAIASSIGSGRMPPLWWRLFAWRSHISQEESKTILHWVENSLKTLTTVITRPEESKRL